jgi:Family of unknown function (DUF6082)
MANNRVDDTYLREVYHSPKGREVAAVLKRATVGLALILATVAVLALVAISPLALKQLTSIRAVNWGQLSNIGQTYGAASALLTGLALVGVAGSMIFQIRAIDISRAQTVRQQHAHLIEMALMDPVYMRAWGHDPMAYGGADRSRQLFYINLILSFWEDGYRLGSISENIIRGDLAIMFCGEAGREFWAIARYARLQTSHDRRNKRFAQIAEEEFQKATSIGPPAVRAEEPPSPLPEKRRVLLHNSTIKGGTTLLLGAVGGIAFENLLRRSKR